MKKPSIFLLLMTLILGVAMLGLCPQARGEEDNEDRYRILREKMVRTQISHPPDYRDPVNDPKVLDAMKTIPRHQFVRPRDVKMAYRDHPIPIGYGQTISQPYIVALMTEMLDLKPEHRVLEVGTGSGYQAAVLSYLVKEVYTVEIIEPLGKKAVKRLEHLNFSNVRVKIDDGYFGWHEVAPFDRIIVTCAATIVPPPLIKQLRRGGKMCIPVGGQYTVQFLTMVEKSGAGKVTMRKSLPVRFVPLTRKSP